MKEIIRILLGYFSAREDHDDPQYPNWREKIRDFERKIGYPFRNPHILHAAMMHLSYFRKLYPDPNAISTFQRMEFLGDAILGLVVAEELFTRYPSSAEGVLSKVKSQVVSEEFLSMRAMTMGLGEYILMSEEEARSGGRKRKSILSDAMEALICAIYMDSNLQKTRYFIKNFVLMDFETDIHTDALTNYKSQLQEYCQSQYQKPPHYTVIKEEGPDHRKIFTVEVYINKEKCGEGQGSNKKQAEQNAARDACQKMKL